MPRNASAISCLPHDGEWLCNLTQITRDGDVTDGTLQADLTYAEIEGRRQVMAYLSFLRDKAPGFENAYLLETGPQVGIRETRRLQGQTVLSGGDILGCASFEDRIGINGWPLEIHMKGRAKWVFLERRGYHEIPFGSTVPKQVRNLFVAGRCASTTPEGQASVRVTGPCYVLGQAADTAADLVLKAGGTVQEVDVTQLQNVLSEQGAILSPEDI